MINGVDKRDFLDSLIVMCALEPSRDSLQIFIDNAINNFDFRNQAELEFIYGCLDKVISSNSCFMEDHDDLISKIMMHDEDALGNYVHEISKEYYAKKDKQK